ncbi:hypothetical protein BU26DRAFT_608648 [Trematosphaeria pertusa]|uniref:Uncharacterized protein n=1 Tax=Trematosphaeria pertusa TaxID=390896 RepID=A0A6A6I1M6_9PLEO|nr:uncharacterized protein BU26DRAFT_608648 [Trematosphaeria pertusa]KAF2244186.1 hypothetical protein BU26DRAFT_608648 [Trematosphaeria pertusa]
MLKHKPNLNIKLQLKPRHSASKQQRGKQCQELKHKLQQKRKRRRRHKRTFPLNHPLTLSELEQLLRHIPKKVPKEKLEIHYAANIPLHDPDSQIRDFNTYTIQQQLEKETEVRRAFAETHARMQAGDEAVPIENPYKENGYWVLYSSEYFTRYLVRDIDVLDFERCGGDGMLCFHREKRVCVGQIPRRKEEKWGTVSGAKELDGWFGRRLVALKTAQREPIVLETGAPVGEVRVWFAAGGYLKLQADLSQGAGRPVVVTWWEIQQTERRKAADLAAWRERTEAEE